MRLTFYDLYASVSPSTCTKLGCSETDLLKGSMSDADAGSSIATIIIKYMRQWGKKSSSYVRRSILRRILKSSIYYCLSFRVIIVFVEILYSLCRRRSANSPFLRNKSLWCLLYCSLAIMLAKTKISTTLIRAVKDFCSLGVAEMRFRDWLSLNL